MFRLSSWLAVVLALLATVLLVSLPVTQGQLTPSPIIYSIRECGIVVGNGSSGCNSYDRIFIRGVNLPTNNTNTSVVLIFDGDDRLWRANNITTYNSSFLSAVLPYNGVTAATAVSVRVQGDNGASNTVNYLSYSDQTPSVSAVSGCANYDPRYGRTSGCQPGARLSALSIYGSNFFRSEFGFVSIAGYKASDCTAVSISMILCYTLPSIDASLYGSYMPVFARVGLLTSDNTYAVMYGSGNSSATCPVSRFLLGYDLPGMDLYHVSQPSVNFAACQTLCCNNPQCVAFTVCQSNFNDSACALNQPCCFLKSGVAVPVLRNNTIAQLSSAVITRSSSSSSSSTGRFVNTTSSSSSSSSSTGRVATVTINNLSGCKNPNRCQAGDYLIITGTGYVSTMSVYLSYNGNYNYCPMVLYSNSSSMTVLLPFVALPNNQPVYLQVVVYYSVYGNQLANASLLFYPTLNSSSSSSSSSTGRSITSSSSSSTGPASTAPVIQLIRGCKLIVGSGTAGCDYNDTILITGTNLQTGSGVAVWFTTFFGGYSTSDVVTFNSTLMSARLPYWGVSQPTTYDVQVRDSSNGVVSNVVKYVTYQNQASTVYKVSGCALDDNITNRTSGCQAGQRVTIDGANFLSPPTFTLMMWVDGNIGGPTCTWLTSSRIVCTLPSNTNGMYDQFLRVSVLSGQLYSNSPYLISYDKNSTISISSRFGCQNPNRCVASDNLQLAGTGFISSMNVMLFANNLYYSCNLTFVNSTRLSITLPVIPISGSQPLNVQVRLYSNDYQVANTAFYLYSTPTSSSSSSSTGRFMASSSSSSSTGARSGNFTMATIYSIYGCLMTVGNGTSGCNTNDTIYILGSNFPVMGSGVTLVLTANNLYQYLATIVTTSSTYMTARLPYIATSVTATLSVQLRVNNVPASNAVSYVSYSSQSPSVYKVSGCAVNDNLNRTSGCRPGLTVTIDGQKFLPSSSYGLTVYISGVPANSITWISSQRISIQLPTVSSSYYNQYLYVQVQSGALMSSAQYLVSYSAPSSSSSTGRFIASSSSSSSLVSSPFISRTTGCSESNSCMASSTLTIFGYNFDSSSQVRLYLGSSTYYFCSLFYRDQNQLRCTLPSIYVSAPTQLGLQVWNGNSVSSNNVWLWFYPPLYWSSSSSTGGAVAVSITSLTGCAISYQCVAYDRLVLSGTGYTSTMQIALQASGVNYYCASTWYYTSTTLVCNSLPVIPIPSSYNYVYVQVQVYNNGYQLATTGMYYYPTPSSSSSSSSTGGVAPPTSTGGSGGGSSSGLTLDDLIVIVLVVVIVVGLLLVCQVVYCLHHFAGVKFPRLARLTGGRLFKVEVEAAEGADINLSLLAHDQHNQHQQPMLQAAHVQPQPAQLPVNAAASHYSPAVYQRPVPLLAPDAQYPGAHPPPAAAAPYLYPRSFVPSPQYYQSS